MVFKETLTLTQPFIVLKNLPDFPGGKNPLHPINPDI